MATKGQKVTFAYRGSFPDGEVFDEHTDTPLQIILGRGQVMKALEDVLMEMEIGEERTVELAAKDAYGDYDEDAVQHVPTYKIPNGANMPVGQYIGWTSPRNIEPIPVKVVEIVNQVATLDFNHPLAGKDIVYWVKVLEISD
jgi:FKBP-type peptidyl-prolyl cis-trans isomerase 2